MAFHFAPRTRLAQIALTSMAFVSGCGTRSSLLWDSSTEPGPSDASGGNAQGTGGQRPTSGGAPSSTGGSAPPPSGGRPGCPEDERACESPKHDFITAPNGDPGDRFGFSLALSGDTLAVGASWEESGAHGVDGDPQDNSASESGAVYVYVRRGSAWVEQAYLKADYPDPGDWFGRRIALDGDTLVIGAYGEDSGGTDPKDNSVPDSGAVYVFVRQGETWSQEAYLKSAVPSPTAWFGRRVAVKDNRIAVGAYGDDRFGENAGSAAIFERRAGTWIQVAELISSNAGSGDQFGSSVALTTNTLIVSAFGEASGNGDPSDDSTPSAGAAYAFSLDGAAYPETAYIKANKPNARDWFGVSLTVSDELLVVGAYGDDADAPDPGTSPGSFARGSGAVHIFERHGATFAPRDFLKAHNPDAGDNFGASVALKGDRLLVGAFGEDSARSSSDNFAPNSGAAYLFEQRRGQFIESRFLKHPSPDAQDRFGWAIDATDDFIAIGAFGDEGAPRTEGRKNAGAVYVFPW